MDGEYRYGTSNLFPVEIVLTKMNKINPKKLLHRKWTAIKPKEKQNGSRFFLGALPHTLHDRLAHRHS